jgi:hypothetical protein
MARCAHCDKEFAPKHQRGRYCSSRCRAAAWQAARRNREDRLRQMVKTLAKEAGLTADDLR